MGSVMTQFMESRAHISGGFEDLTTLRIFVRTVEIGNFSEVARRMGANPAMVSKRIAALESKIGQRLVNRNTRRLVVTEVGQLLYDHAMRALQELDQAAEEMSCMQDQATGHLRLTAPSMLGQAIIAPRLAGFMQQNPLLSIDLNFSMEKLDLYKAGIDIAVRIADVLDPGLMAIRLAPYSRVFCAAPAYLQTHGMPVVPEDLMDHNCLITRGYTFSTRWQVQHDGEIGHVHVKGNFATDSGQTVRMVCLAGMGIMMAPRWLVEPDLSAGTLVEVLGGYVPDNRAVYAVLVQRSGTSAKLQTAIEFLRTCFADMQ
ncbi:HTH-type transcriptional regulator DmlR [Paraburkholderia ultramafica]|uniref:HTH-type transcriptional regulator DmlR n=1 Tax=Paraburkholderia ultramafica TaxID=1544867 RepID=A0A6S7BNH1_9BURK|nr:LysR family transcriptional regulator [Paraburkholderia ultramafica]CAB3807039.1 HTH-type transcriptional regulator DmlR [Paraburkholderia ultramafica]